MFPSITFPARINAFCISSFLKKVKKQKNENLNRFIMSDVDQTKSFAKKERKKKLKIEQFEYWWNFEMIKIMSSIPLFLIYLALRKFPKLKTAFHNFFPTELYPFHFFHFFMYSSLQLTENDLERFRSKWN